MVGVKLDEETKYWASVYVAGYIYSVFMGFLLMPSGLSSVNAFWIAIFWPVLYPFVMALSLAPLVVEGSYFHNYSFAREAGEAGADWFVYVTIGFVLVQLIPWLTVEDKTRVPPGIRFLASFATLPGHAQVARAARSADAPTFDIDAFKAAHPEPAGKWEKRLYAEELNRMAEAANAHAERMKASEFKAAEQERRRAEADEARMKEEKEFAEAELKFMKAAEELERRKARLDERKKGMR